MRDVNESEPVGFAGRPGVEVVVGDSGLGQREQGICRFFGFEDCDPNESTARLVQHRADADHPFAADSMRRFGAAIAGREGVISVRTMLDEASGRLVGIAIFESEEAANALLPLAQAAVADDDFDTWAARYSA